MENIEKRPAGSLQNTLPPGTEKLGKLDILQLALKEGTRGMKQEGLIKGFATTESKFKEWGLDPAKMAGSVSAGIMDFVSKRTRDPNEALQSFTGLIEMVQAKSKEDIALSRENFGMALQLPGYMAGQTDDQLLNLEKGTGIPYDVLEQMRVTDTIDTEMVDEYVTAIEAGEYSINDITDPRMFDRVFKKVNWGSVSSALSLSDMYSSSKQFVEAHPNANYEELYFAITDKYEGLNSSQVKMILEEAGKFEASKVKGAQVEINQNIEDYITEWERSGDTGKIEDEVIGTREDLISRLIDLFPEFSKDQIHKMVYERITDEWLEEKKNRWWNPLD